MPPLTISDLPPELLYTILSHALARILFDYLFIGPLVPNDTQTLHSPPKAAVGGNGSLFGLEAISSIGQVSLAWRITLQRILGALLQRDVQSLNLKQQHLHRAHQLTARYHASATSTHHPISDSLAANNTTCINATITTSPTQWSEGLHQYRGTLRAMQEALRELLQLSIDRYRTEQDAMTQANHQTGVTTPTLLPTPSPVPSVSLPSTPPLAPHSIPPLSHVVGAGGGAGGGASPAVSGQHVGLSISITGTAAGPVFPFSRGTIVSEGAKKYATIPLFQQALCYSQAAIFTVASSRSLSWCGGGGGGCSPLSPRPLKSSTAGISAIARVQRPDLSTLLLTTPRLAAASEWTRISRGEGGGRICPREIREVVDCAMGEVRESIEEAAGVCRWNDLLDGVFLRGERSEEVLESLDRCFEELEVNASTIQMQHLLRSNLFKTVQTIARLGPISVFGHGLAQGNAASSPEAWRSRAGALAFRWTGRVIEETGL